MNTVCSFLGKIGGSVRVVLGEAKDPLKEYYGFYFSIHVPLQHMKPLGLCG
ncbi:MAG: hypothetical protein M3Q07_02165 [Pseudobdellovibrionaceae bacterium]|nr:hypothetical protein [Pseudobdellovibrionaceae bacterium]